MAAFVAAIAALAGPSTSRAAYTVTFKQTGYSDVTITDEVFGPVGSGDQTAGANAIGTGTFVFGNYSVSVNSSTNSPGGIYPGSGGAVGGFLTQNSFVVTALALGVSPLTIIVSADGFVIPGISQAQVSNSISSTALDGNAAATTTVSPTTGGSFTTGPATLTGPFSGFHGMDTFGLTTITGTPYTITNTLVISNMGSVGNTANITTTSTVTAPAPAGLILAATGVPFFGLLRRRLRRPETTTAA